MSDQYVCLEHGWLASDGDCFECHMREQSKSAAPSDNYAIVDGMRMYAPKREAAPREWWVMDPSPGQVGFYISENKTLEGMFKVIEKSAFDAVVKERDAAVRRYKEISSSASDFQVIDHQAAVIERLEGELKDANTAADYLREVREKQNGYMDEFRTEIERLEAEIERLKLELTN